ncbi:MAG: hypothetical protein LC803_19765 [Acidobacteria bacterium]|nr:hypothetical protein [Acidobacteriota bacterium]
MKLLIGWGLILIIIVNPLLCLGQERERVIIWQWQSVTLPPCPIIRNRDGKTTPTNLMALEVVNILVKKKSVALGQPFVADDDWMRNLKVRVRNISRQPIVHVWLHFSLPEAKNGEIITGFSLDYGKRVGAVVIEGEHKLALPGEEFELTRSEAEYERDSRWIAQWSGVTSISRVWFGQAVVGFEDKTVWGGWPRMRNILANPQCP